MSGRRAAVLVAVAAAVGLFFALAGHRYLTLENVKAQQARLGQHVGDQAAESRWIEANHSQDVGRVAAGRLQIRPVQTPGVQEVVDLADVHHDTSGAYGWRLR